VSMKVVCVDNSNFGGAELFLSIGKIYDVLNIDNHGYRIFNDVNLPSFYSKNKFILLSDHRESKLNELLNS